MKRINEKVKDIVEVRKFLSLRDFTEDAAATLEAYRFTEATSELMTKWLYRIVDLQNGEGSALALAGYRGVGKSHFLAAVAAIGSQPELRTKIGDEHVAAAAQRLLRRRYPCIFVRRGTRSSLLEELKAAIATTFSIDESGLPERTFDILNAARVRSGDVPFLLFIDTAMERPSRVARDDGAILSEIAEAVKPVGGLVGVALDDDIAGADGSNAAIVGSYGIDYLDQEHLYKVVDSHVFPKYPNRRPVLHEVYEYFRSVIPTFRWSEQRFGSLYPLHPSILDVAPFVRLYVNDFALLSFAAEAGERILGRPANSLIALDEVFDAAETELRKSEELKNAFDTYDRLNSDVVGNIPVMRRLQAKLILKALLILSLEGQGTTAGEISSGTLIFDESDPEKANQTVEEIVRMFAAAMPDDVKVYAEEGREVRYGLNIGGNDGLKNALEAAAVGVTKGQVSEMLLRLFHERFHDSMLIAPDGALKFAGECSVIWRGGTRRGRVVWQDGLDSPAIPTADEHHDWEVLIDLSACGEVKTPTTDLPRAVWQPAQPTPDESDAIRRFFILQNEPSIREEFPEHIRSAYHAHILILDRVLNRIFMEDGRFVINGVDHNLTEDARSAGTLSALFSSTLQPLFEARFPQHPHFLGDLGVAEVSRLVSDLYSGSREKMGEVQPIAKAFGLPLGLVELRGGVYFPASREQLATLASVKVIESLLENSDGTVELNTVYHELRKPPNGLVREAQQLILAAMVAQRMVEFVTSKGDRINQRSLDLKMIWDDIVGLARTQESYYSSAKLTKWAVSFSGREDIKDPSLEVDLQKFREGAAEWLSSWDNDRVLGRFNSVPEELLNTAIWKIVTGVSRSLGAAASLIRKFLEGQTSVEECLGRLSEVFLDDPTRLESAKADLEVARCYLEGWKERERFLDYVLSAAPTGDEAIETSRDAVLSHISEFESAPSVERERKIGYAFSRFQHEFSEFYTSKHDSVMRSHALQENAERFFSSDSWWLYTSLADLPTSGSIAAKVERLKARLDLLDCSWQTQSNLESYPQCRCGYDPAFHNDWQPLISELEAAVHLAADELVHLMYDRLSDVPTSFRTLAPDDSDPRLTAALGDVIRFLESGRMPTSLTSDHARAFRVVGSLMPTPLFDNSDHGKRLLTEADVESAVLSLS